MLGCFTLAGGCGDREQSNSDAGACLEPLPVECDPLFEPPSFELIYDQILETSCSAGTGSACHAEAGAQGGLVLAGRERAYDELLGLDGNEPLVIAGDPECSMLVRRIESYDPAFRMPRGNRPLDPRERCVVRQWIAQGAEGP
jgi:hypothetical protein